MKAIIEIVTTKKKKKSNVMAETKVQLRWFRQQKCSHRKIFILQNPNKNNAMSTVNQNRTYYFHWYMYEMFYSHSCKISLPKSMSMGHETV